MKENKDKERYEAPCTRRTQVCLESGICSSSITPNNDTNSGGIEEHKVNEDFNFKFDDNDWDNVGQQ